MNLLTDAMSGLGAVLLPVAAGLLLEELTLGGLVRLLMTPWLVSGRQEGRGQRFSSPQLEARGSTKGKGEGK